MDKWMVRYRWGMWRRIVIGVCFLAWSWCWPMGGVSTAYGQPAGTRSLSDHLLLQFSTYRLAIDRSQIFPGGPAKDGIPALVRPQTVPVTQSPFEEGDRVVAVTVGGQTRGYPLKVLNWHEVINDVLGDVPVAVIYCPLCDSVTVVDRRIDDAVLEFGVSGLLHNSNVLIYDRTSLALWSQLGFEAISGPYVGRSLRMLPWQLIRVDAFKKQYADAQVVSTQTGYRRDYHRSPYDDYFQDPALMFPVTQEDDRLPAKSAVIGVRWRDQIRAYPVSSLQQEEERTIRDMYGDREPLVIQVDADGGVSIVKSPRDAQIAHTFWFAWSAFYPNTAVYTRTPTTGLEAAADPS